MEIGRRQGLLTPTVADVVGTVRPESYSALYSEVSRRLAGFTQSQNSSLFGREDDALQLQMRPFLVA